MHCRRRLGTAVLALILGSGCADTPASPPDVEEPKSAALVVPQARPGHYFIRFRGSSPPRTLSTAIASSGAAVEHDFRDIGYLVVRGLTTNEAARLAALPEVEAVAPDYDLDWLPRGELRTSRRRVAEQERRIQADQSSAIFFSDQWNLRNVRTPAAWRETPAGAGALVCVLDTGVDPGHIDLIGRVDVAKSASFVPAEPFLDDLNAHGTFVSAIITSNGFGVASVAPEATLCAIKVLDGTGFGSFGAVIGGLFHAANVGADIANLSLTAYVPKTLPGVDVLIAALTEAVALVREDGVQVIAAAGNDGVDLDNDGDNIVLPAEIRGVISVAANAPFQQTGFNALASYSNFGGRLGGVDITAPGGDLIPGGFTVDLILSACSRFVCGADGVYIFGSGTSFAAPHVAGVSALAESWLPGNQAAGRLDRCLLRNAVPIDRRYGAGRLDALRAGRCIR